MTHIITEFDEESGEWEIVEPAGGEEALQDQLIDSLDAAAKNEDSTGQPSLG